MLIEVAATKALPPPQLNEDSAPDPAADGATNAAKYARGFDSFRGGGGTQTVIHRVEVVGELDAKRAVAAIHQRIDQRATDVYHAERDFEEGHGLD